MKTTIVQKVQQRAVRQVSGLTSTTYEGKLLELDLPTLEERRHQADMCTVHKILHGKGDLKAVTWFERDGHGENNESRVRPLEH